MKKALVGIIAAVSKNGYIGMDGHMPWQKRVDGKLVGGLEGDLKHFQNTTTGNGNNAIIVGRKTLESWGNKPLPNRVNVVLSRDPEYQPPVGVKKYSELSTAIMSLERTVDEIWVCGGAQVYTEALNTADTIVLTETFNDFEGDVEFPKVNNMLWKEKNRQAFGERKYCIVTYKRI